MADNSSEASPFPMSSSKSSSGLLPDSHDKCTLSFLNTDKRRRQEMEILFQIRDGPTTRNLHLRCRFTVHIFRLKNGGQVYPAPVFDDDLLGPDFDGSSSFRNSFFKVRSGSSPGQLSGEYRGYSPRSHGARECRDTIRDRTGLYRCLRSRSPTDEW
jgi:hypothetical protein